MCWFWLFHSQQHGDKQHAEWTTLRYSTPVEVTAADGVSKDAFHIGLFVKINISKETNFPAACIGENIAGPR